MATRISDIETLARRQLIETTPRFWTSQEMTDITITGIKDLWRSIVNLKQEHYLTVNGSDVYFGASATTLSGVPTDVHKVYNIEPRDLSANGTNKGLIFSPLDFNHRYFQSARGMDAIDPADAQIYYAVTSPGGPVAAPVIYCAPQVNSPVNLTFSYVPNLPDMTTNSIVPIPGEATNALIAWTVAYARAKERQDKAPDPVWMTIYSTEKQQVLEGLGQRQYQENTFAEAVFQDFWG